MDGYCQVLTRQMDVDRDRARVLSPPDNPASDAGWRDELEVGIRSGTARRKSQREVEG